MNQIILESSNQTDLSLLLAFAQRLDVRIVSVNADTNSPVIPSPKITTNKKNKINEKTEDYSNFFAQMISEAIADTNNTRTFGTKKLFALLEV